VASVTTNVMSGESVARRGSAIAGSDERGEAVPLGRRLEGIDGTGSDLSRILSLSDGIFAFALTFLAVTLLLPQALGSSPLPVLTRYLQRLEPAFIGYLLSFFVIASWWNVHHRLFSCIVRYDRMLVRLNLYFLLVISVTPFLVSLLFAYSSTGWGPGTVSARLAVTLYAVIQAIGGGMLLGIWRHATRGHRLVAPSVTKGWIQSTEDSQLVRVIVFAVSIGIAWASPLIAELSWIVMILGLGRPLWRRPRAPHSSRTLD